MLSEMQQKFLKTVTDMKDMIKGCGDEKNQPSDHPPKAWFDKTSKDVKAGNPDYSDEQVRATVGSIWYKKMGGKKRAEIKKRGKSGVAKSFQDAIINVMGAFDIDIQKGDAKSVSDETETKQEVSVEKLIKAIDTLKEIFGSVEIKKSVAGEKEKSKSEPAYRVQSNEDFFKAIIIKKNSSFL